MRIRVILTNEKVVTCVNLTVNVGEAPYDVAGQDSQGHWYRWYANEVFAIELVPQ